MRMRPRFASMPVALAVGVTAAVVLACAAGAYAYSSHHFQTLMDNARASALSQGELILAALEHQMMENERNLIARMIENFGRQPRVEQVMLLDRYGVERYSSGPAPADRRLHIDSPTCQACHRYPPEQRGSSRVIETRGGAVLRTVVPIRNKAECHGCHNSGHRINGVLILDYNAGEIRAAMTRELRWMVLGTGALTLLLVGAIAVIIRLVVLRRLQRFETAARQIAAGDLERRVPAEGSDTLAWLAREFNTMADSVTGLVGEVRSQRERLETVINSIDDGIVVLDPERRIVAANDSFLRRTGHARQEMLGCCCKDMAPSGACNGTSCPTLTCLASGARQIRISERRKPEGGIAWEEIHASPIIDASGKLTHVVEVWRDISERRAAEAHLAESHRLASLGFLASGFSHELNTPLATVLTCVEGIMREAGPGGRIRDSAAIARDQVLRCRTVTQQFLRMSRGERSAVGIVDVDATIAAVARLVQPAARAQGVTVEIEAGVSGLHARADEAELQNVIINLLLNAIQASEPRSTVSVRVQGGPPPSILVTDRGCGIPPEQLKRIFEPFFSLREGGTGLGLFLSLNAVRRWGGDIRVSSQAHQGSTFEVLLP